MASNTSGIDAWAEVTISGGGNPAWDDVTGKPSEFPPETHGHDGC